MLRFGPYEAFFEKWGRGPKRPEVFADVHYALDVFEHLNAARTFTEAGPMPIPVSEVIAYATAYGISDVEELLSLVQSLDKVWLEHVRRKILDGSPNTSRDRRAQGKAR